jgi:hypothetical protein
MMPWLRDNCGEQKIPYGEGAQRAPFSMRRLAVALAACAALAGCGVDDAVEEDRAPLETVTLSRHVPASLNTWNPLTFYEKKLPHVTQPPISWSERSQLAAYLDKPDSLARIKRLAKEHLSQSLLDARVSKGKGLKHSILALYFLSRARDLGAQDPWIMHEIADTETAIDAILALGDAYHLEEDHPAHVFYRETFHLNKEYNRYIALDRLLEDFVQQPKNVYSAFVLTAVNLWIGGEADYDDPTTVYNFALGSFFSLHTMKIARALEEAWTRDPKSATRFRLAANLGGFSLLQRRWLAAAHHDDEALEAADDEHRAWMLVHPSFHSFTLGYSFFDNADLFQEGKEAMEAATWHCEAVPVRTCTNLPRFSFVQLGFNLGYIDFLLKNGDVDLAREWVQLRNTDAELDNWAAWSIGRDSWLHREQNLEAISALYRNDNPNDDPINFEMKRRRWGVNTTTCQECHQVQGKKWTAAQFNEIQLPPEEVASVRNWPEVLTTWYAGAKN